MGDDRVIHFTRTKTKKVNLIRTVFGREPCGECGYKPDEGKGVVKSCVECFLDDHRLFRFEYNVGISERILKKSGTCSVASSDMAKKVTERAKDMLNSDNQFGEYHLIDNNCESFAFYCTTGLRMTMQGNAFKDAIESVYKTLTNSESLFKGFIDKKIRRFMEEHDLARRSEITNNDDDDDGSDQDRSD
ncbi:hypothetical protein G4B88_014678 [Cannabis sativa]|uniref:LRAT domain-containing protein n=1 Tax=Cannabis sativa TaxID=3483 RepID=A0A7J6I9E1_CANSA|nr:hypothetical protein G4B88_014678 [Cannabis sativa]